MGDVPLQEVVGTEIKPAPVESKEASEQGTEGAAGVLSLSLSFSLSLSLSLALSLSLSLSLFLSPSLSLSHTHTCTHRSATLALTRLQNYFQA